MKPILRWCGGKTRLVDKIVEQLPRGVTSICEPFAGAASLTFARVDLPAGLGDQSAGLIKFYRDLRSNPMAVWDSFSHIGLEEFDYYEARKWWNQTHDAGCFLYINVYGFNGVWRVNQHGECNVPFGRERHGKRPELVDVVNAATRLGTTELVVGDWQQTLGLWRGDFVYLDPPYPGTYNYGLKFDHSVLVEKVLKLDSQVLLSYPDLPWIRDAFRDWDIISVSTRQSIQKGSSRVRSELLIRNYPLQQE